MSSNHRRPPLTTRSGMGGRGPKTSSERGRAYRERMRLQEKSLEADAAQLRRVVSQLLMRRTVAETYALQRRHDPTGSLAKLVCKYYTFFQDSMAALPPVSPVLLARHDAQATMELELQCQSQAQFLRHIMDPNVIVGDLAGPLAILDQWRRYAASHGSFRGHILSISTSGPEDNAVVTLRARATGRITGATFCTLFPHAIRRRDAFIQKFLDRDVAYNITNRYMFNADGRIYCEIVDVGFVEGLLQAGATLKEVAQLMEGSVISKHCTLRRKARHEAERQPRSIGMKRPSFTSSTSQQYVQEGYNGYIPRHRKETEGANSVPLSYMYG